MQCGSMFAFQLAKYLMLKLPEMGQGSGEPNDKSTLYSRLWRNLFTFTQKLNQGR